ncbi:MAG TPA: hypothetical protein VNH18_05270 [Bryobacteraceae bacterium]|nr:hypothetical protein [Bryobacteraceae bacterium]HXJ38665.1 hypothetical protein [Bryobacteraceae bacterium]
MRARLDFCGLPLRATSAVYFGMRLIHDGVQFPRGFRVDLHSRGILLNGPRPSLAIVRLPGRPVAGRVWGRPFRRKRAWDETIRDIAGHVSKQMLKH